MITVTFRGTNYSIPEPGDAFAQSLTDYLNALSTGAVPYPTTADVDLGSSGFGLKSAYFKTRTASPSASGLVRLALADLIAWRNNANNADLALGVGAQDQLQWRGSDVTGNPMASATTAAGQSIANGATEITVVFGTEEVDTDAAFNPATGQFTVPTGKGGHYEIAASIAYNTAPTGTCTCSIFKNAVLFKQNQFIAPGAIQGISVCALASLSAGDVIDIRTKHGNGAPQNLVAAPTINFFTIKRIPA